MDEWLRVAKRFRYTGTTQWRKNQGTVENSKRSGEYSIRSEEPYTYTQMSLCKYQDDVPRSTNFFNSKGGHMKATFIISTILFEKLKSGNSLFSYFLSKTNGKQKNAAFYINKSLPH